ncbi:MAG: sigma-70 family RNA polymerase sigma factor [Gemmataceae bacterium]|nr:sigma-70 family RNA polymerase sigma factor [Gemmataceae bacterium]
MLRGRLAALVGRLRQRVGRPGADASDQALLECFANQCDGQAFAALVWRHSPLVLGVCRRILPDAHAAEDAFQAVFLVLARKAGSIRHHQALSSWLFRVAYRIALRGRADLLRQRAHERQESDMAQADRPAATMEHGDDPADEAARREFRGVLDAELDRLPEKYRAPLVLCYLQGKTNEEAARELGWPAGSMSRHLERARTLLQKRLVQRGAAFSQAALMAALADGASAAVPARLQEYAVSVGMQFASGNLATSQSVLWAEGALHAMKVARHQLLLILTTTVGLLGLGAGLVVHAALAGPGEAGENAIAAGDEKAPVQVREAADGHGDALPTGAVARLGSERYRMPFPASSVLFTPDGKRLGAAGFMTGGLHWFDTASGRKVTPAKEDWSSQGTPVFSADGRFAVLVRVHYYAPPNARKATACHSLAIWDIQAGKSVGWLLEHRGTDYTPTFGAVAFTPDGKHVVAAGSDRSVRFWRVPRCTLLGQAKLPDGAATINVLAVSPDSKSVAGTGDDKQIRLWELATARERSHFAGHAGKTLAMRFDADGALLSVGIDGTLRHWDVDSGKEVKQFRVAIKDRIAGAALAPDGRTAAVPTGEGGKVKLWDTASGRASIECVMSAGSPDGLAFSADGKVLATTAHSDQLVHLWDVATGKALNELPGHANGVRALGWSPDGRTVATGGESWDGSARLWDATNGSQRLVVRPRYGAEAATFFAPDGRTFFTAGLDGAVHQWETAGGKEVRQFRGTHTQVWAAALSPDGKTLAMAGGGAGIFLLDVASGERKGDPLGKDGWHGLSFSRDGKFLVGVNQKDHTACVWDLAKRQETVVARAVQGGISGIALSPDGKWLATVSSGVSSGGQREDGLVRVYEVSGGKEVFTLAGSERGLLRVAFSPDGKQVAAGGHDALVRVWDVASRKEIFAFSGHTRQIECLAFSPDGQRLASGSWDALGYVWNVGDKR